MRILYFPAALAAVTLCSPLRAEIVINEITPLVLNVSAATCPGIPSDIVGSGKGITQVRLTVDKNGNFHLGAVLTGSGKGTDAFGGKWVFADADLIQPDLTDPGSFNGNLSTGPYEFTFTENFHLIGLGTNINLTVHGIVHVRVAQDGSVTVSFERTRGEENEGCEGIFVAF